MNIQEIRNLTEEVKKKHFEAGKKAAATAKANVAKARREKIELYKDVSFFEEKIAGAARKGKNEYFISLDGDEDNSDTRLRMKYIKKKLSDFNPTFTRDAHETCKYNWEGTSIDGTERTYYAMTVHFEW